MTLPRAHLWLGLMTLVVFLLTGQFMGKALNHLAGMADGPRMLFRSSHIYLLWSGLLNASLGLQPRTPGPGWRGGLRRLGSVLILAGPPLLLASFLLESPLGDLHRPCARAANVFAVVGFMLHLMAYRWSGEAEKR